MKQDTVCESPTRRGANQLFDNSIGLFRSLGRLTREMYNGPTADLQYATDYVMDLVGNRLAKNTDHAPAAGRFDDYRAGDPLDADETVTSTFDANDRLLTEAKDVAGTADDRFTRYEYGPGATVTPSFGGNGTEQTAKTVRAGLDDSGAVLEQDTITYDLEGRMIGDVQDQTGAGLAVTTSTYAYDADGARISQTVDSVKTVYLNDGQNPTGYTQVLEEKDSDLNVTKTYTLGQDVIAQQSPAGVQPGALYLLYDGHGSTRGLLDATGQPLTAQVYRYDAFGNRLDTSSALTSLLYSGEQTDPTGLQYLRARYYDPRIGRFPSLDPFAGDMYDPQSLHKSLYCQGDAINFVDAAGLYPGFPWPVLFPSMPLPDEIQVPVLGTLVHSYLGTQFKTWAFARNLDAWANQENRTIVWDIMQKSYARERPYNFKPDMVSWAPGGTTVDVYEMKHADIILDAPSYTGKSLFAALQLYARGIFPLSGMAPGLSFRPGTAFASGYQTWPSFPWSPPGWELISWTNYTMYPGVILYDWVPDRVGAEILMLTAIDVAAAALVIESLGALSKLTSLGAAGSELVNASNSLNGLPPTAPPAPAWYATAASIGVAIGVGGIGFGGGV